VPPEGCTLTRAIEANARVKRSEIPIGDRLYDVVATPILKDDGSLDHVILVYIDITERHRALDELARSEARYRDLFENANDLIQIADCGGRLLYVNRAWREAMGYGAEELPGLTMDRVLAEACRSAYQDTVRAACEKRGGSVVAETVFVSKGGQQLQLDGNISCSGEGAEGKKLVRAIFRDVTQQRRMEEEIVKVQRLESLGYLAGGIAHDFNNVLTAVVGNINLAKLYEDRGFKVREKLEKAEKALLRAKNLTQKLLTFSQGGEPIRKRLVLDRFVADTAEMALTGSPVRLDFSAQEGLRVVMCDQRQIEQVLQNLVSNASHAMPRGGVLTVRCRNIGAEEARAYPLERGEYVAISIRDEGTGIPRENLGRIFDPFFSTKEGGMGLGLATAYSIAKKHGGLIRVESELGRGSEFTVFLPVASAETEEEKAEVAGRMQGGRILVMDDEEEILDLVKTFLEYAGYEVAIARDGAEAVRLYRDDMERGLPFDLFLTDLTVPGGMGGLEALQRIRTVDRDVLAVVSSGYSDDPVMSGYRNYGFSGVAVKPYRLETLSNLVGTLIGEKRERAGS
jgi:PAS domain S-box-containing protein